MNSAADTPTTKPIISLRDVGMRWDSRVVLEHIDLDVRRGDFMLITGPNGGGKTTLLRIMLRLLKPTAGKVVYDFDSSSRIGYLPQKNAIDSMFPITVREVVASGLLASRTDKATVSRRVSETLDSVGLTHHADSSIGQLSGGQLQRALLGRAMISQPALLVLDEPLSYIDKRFEHHLYYMLDQIRRTTTIVLVSHEFTTLAGMANRSLVVDHRLYAQ